MKPMKPKEAAAVIGCSPRHVCHLCQTGKLKARRQPTTLVAAGYVWSISPAEARRYRDNRPRRGPRARREPQPQPKENER